MYPEVGVLDKCDNALIQVHRIRDKRSRKHRIVLGVPPFGYFESVLTNGLGCFDRTESGWLRAELHVEEGVGRFQGYLDGAIIHDHDAAEEEGHPLMGRSGIAMRFQVATTSCAVMGLPSEKTASGSILNIHTLWSSLGVHSLKT